MMLLKYMLD